MLKEAEYNKILIQDVLTKSTEGSQQLHITNTYLSYDSFTKLKHNIRCISHQL